MEIDFNKMNEANDAAAPGAGGATDEFVITKIPSSVADEIHQKMPAQSSLDIAAVKAAFKGFKSQIDQVRSSITGFEIETDDDAKTFVQTVQTAKGFINKIESKRKSMIKEADQYVRQSNAFVRAFRKPLEDLERLGKQKIGQYNYKLEMKRREDEKKLKDAADKVQADIDAQAKAAGVESLKLPPMAVSKKIHPIRTGTGTGSTRYKTTFEIVDFAKLDDAFKMVDEKKLQAAIDAGLRPAGVKLVEKPIVSIRSV